MKSHNFFAGPAVLPEQVKEKASQAAKSLDEMGGLSILEISHRSAFFTEVMQNACSLVNELLGLNYEFDILFLTGGASSQFFFVPLNILNANEKAAYVNTGTWSTKAIKEANRYGLITELASSKDQNFNYIPKGYDIPTDLRYLHLTSNNTIFGTQLKELPDTSVPIVCDMSSDIFSRPIDGSRYDVIYAGAQKNLGPAGTTIVAVRKGILGKTYRDIPTMLDYNTHIGKGSMFNTPPVYPVYVCYLTLQWLKDLGGVSVMEKRNIEKATLLYNEIDRNSMFKGTTAVEDRSLMNACFLLEDDSKEQAFLDACKEANIMGIKGHRSVGGFRASIYNALAKESVETLVDVMKSFEAKHG